MTIFGGFFPSLARDKKRRKEGLMSDSLFILTDQPGPANKIPQIG